MLEQSSRAQDRMTSTAADHTDSSPSNEDSNSEEDSLSSLSQAGRAEISRNRSFSMSARPKGTTTRVAGGPSTKLKRLSALERLADVPGENLTVSLGSLYCNACHVKLGWKKSIVASHVRTERHREGKVQLLKAAAHQTTICPVI